MFKVLRYGIKSKRLLEISEKLCTQVAYLLASPETMKRAFSVLQKLSDNYPKMILCMDTLAGDDVEGILQADAVECRGSKGRGTAESYDGKTFKEKCDRVFY